MNEIKDILSINICNSETKEPILNIFEKDILTYPEWEVVMKENDVKILKTNPKKWLIAKVNEMNKSCGSAYIKDLPWIQFNKDVVYEYRIIRSCKHDGTLVFTDNLITEALSLLLNQQSYYKITAPYDFSTVAGIDYEIGEMELKTRYGTVDLPIGRCMGQKDTITIPVRCNYRIKE